jgi:hypothetical protein
MGAPDSSTKNLVVSINTQEQEMLANTMAEKIGETMKSMKDLTWRIDNSKWNVGMYLNHALLKTDKVSADEAFACYTWGVILTKKQNIMQDNLDDWEIIKNAMKTKMLENHPSLAFMFDDEE